MKSKWRVYVLIKSKVAETTPFYLNETVRSNQNMMFWFKIISFWLMPGQKKKKAKRCIVWQCLLSSSFGPIKS
jgi:hypothetical protein